MLRLKAELEPKMSIEMGRPSVTIWPDERRIVRLVEANPKITSREIDEQF